MRRLACALFCAAVAAIPSTLFAQEFRGQISGTITDALSAVIPGANVTVTEIHTGTRIPTVATSTGQYTVPFLLPGDYDIAVRAPGFREFVRKGVHVGADERAVIDIRMEVGEVTQSVEVTADAALVNTENASLGQSVNTKEVEELPINGRTPMIAATLSLGVIAYAQPTLIHPFDSGAAAGWSVGGAYTQTSELLLDGSPNATWDGRLAYSPPQDAVQEVRVKVSDTDAAFGHTAGGTLNQVLKTGTNTLHGSLWEFNQPNTLTANDFFLNKNLTKRPVTHLNQYGVTAGGPVMFPKVLDGRNRLFWFFAWEAMKDGQPNPFTTTVPVSAWRKGDFSSLLPGTVIYDPYSAVQSGSTITRTPLPNNTIPTSRLNPVAQAYLQYYPDPTFPNLTVNNYTSAPNTTDNYSNELGRIDYNMSDRSRMFFDIRHTDYWQTKNNYFNNIAEGSILRRNNWGASLDEVYVINPRNMLNVRLNFTRMNEGHDMPSVGFDPTTLGFPTSMTTNSQYLQMPVISFSSNSGLQKLAATGADRIPSQSYQLFANWMLIKGSHSLKFGGDLRQYRLNTFTAGNSTGSFSFSGNSWVRASSSASSTVVAGQDLASFLYGLPYAGSSSVYDVNTYGSWYSYYTAVFLQDDWKIKSNLTLNLGVRFDHDGPYNEVHGRTVNGFDTTSASPLSAAAIAAYGKSPITQLPISAFQVLGGLTFPNDTAVYQNTSHLVSPRVGFAWTPSKFKGKTVIRGGFGMFVAPVTITAMGIDGKYSTSPDTNQEGFSQSTTVIPTNDNYLTPAATLSNPFPSGFLTASGAKLGLATFAGQTITFLNPQVKSPYSMRWNFGFQHTLSSNLLLEAVYIGNHSVHLPIDYTQLNGIPKQYLSTLGVRDPALNYMTNTVANPFSGLQTSQNSASTTPAQILARFPQFPVGTSATGWTGGTGIIEQNLSAGSSYFDSLNIRLQKRASHGLSFTFNYIYSKLIEQNTWLNDSDPVPEKRVSAIDHPHRFATAFTYEFPFGKGRTFNLSSRWANLLAGGWALNTVYTYQTGAPLSFLNGSTNSPGDYVYLGGPLNLNNRSVDTTAFDITRFDTTAANQFNYHVRTFSTTFSNLRIDGINQLDSSLGKRIDFTERVRMQLRFEGFNIINHPVFAAPNTTVSNKQFGMITATANRFRTFQVGARLVF